MPADLSSQANIPSQRSKIQRDVSKIASTPWSQISASLVVAVTSAGQVALPACRHATIRLIQNVGVTPVKFLVGDEDVCQPGKYHQILRAGVAMDDGQGGQADFSKLSQRVTVCTEVGSTGSVAIFYALAPENL